MYEFHLPMNYIQEEGSFDKTPQQRNHRLTKGKLSPDRKPKDDVSSQMMDATTYRDLHNSQLHFHEHDYLTKYGSKSQIPKHPRRSEAVFQSDNSIRDSHARHEQHLNSVQHDAATLIAQPSLENQFILGLPTKLNDTNDTRYLLSEKSQINKGEIVLVKPATFNQTPFFKAPELETLLQPTESALH